MNPKRILIIPLRYIGDTILTVPLIRNVRHAFPNAKIDLLASPVTASLMETCPYVNQVLIEPKSTPARLNLLKANRYDMVFLLRKSVTMAALCKLAGIQTVVGYDKQRYPFGYKRWGWFLDIAARYPGLKTDTPQAVSHLSLLSACGLSTQDDYLELWATDADQKNIDQLLSLHGISSEKPLAVLHAASASHGKQIETAKFSESLKCLIDAGYQVLATGTKNDQTMYEQLKQQSGIPLINLAGQTTLRETFALYQRIQLLLTVDSSPIHMGAAAGVPKIVGVFGPTNERQWGPHNPNVQFQPVFMDLPCRPCYAKICSHNNCRVQLTGSQIQESLKQIL